jgi:hypothetical protein
MRPPWRICHAIVIPGNYIIFRIVLSLDSWTGLLGPARGLSFFATPVSVPGTKSHAAHPSNALSCASWPCRIPLRQGLKLWRHGVASPPLCQIGHPRPSPAESNWPSRPAHVDELEHDVEHFVLVHHLIANSPVVGIGRADRLLPQCLDDQLSAWFPGQHHTISLAINGNGVKSLILAIIPYVAGQPLGEQKRPLLRMLNFLFALRQSLHDDFLGRGIDR